MRCINQAQMTKRRRNLKSVAPKTAEISSIQISTNARTATPRDRRIFVSLLTWVRYKNIFFGSETNTLHFSYQESKNAK
jgi:hypothetical protein